MIPPKINYRIVSDIKSLDSEFNPVPGDLVFSVGENAIYMWDGDKYLLFSYDTVPIDIKPDSLYLTIYNKYNHD